MKILQQVISNIMIFYNSMQSKFDQINSNILKGNVDNMQTLMSAGSDFTCNVYNKNLNCWGSNKQGQVKPPLEAQSNLAGFTAGFFHACSILASRDFVCWGLNNMGQTEVPAKQQGNVVSAFASWHTCVLLESNSVDGNETLYFTYQDSLIFGLKENSALINNKPNDNTNDQKEQTKEMSLKNQQRKISIECFGANEFSQSIVPEVIPKNIISGAAGGKHSCVISSTNQLFCFGDNTKGQSEVPLELQSNSYSIAAGYLHSCSIGLYGLVCFGSNESGQSVRQRDTGDLFLFISAGLAHSCTQILTGLLECWGDDRYGQSSQEVVGLSSSLTSGSYHNCIRHSKGSKVECWGLNNKGQCDAINIQDHYD